MGLFLGNSKISFKIGALAQVSEERIVSQMSSAIAQTIQKIEAVESCVVQNHFYSEQQWNTMTSGDTVYDSVPDGMIYIYEDFVVPDSSEFDTASCVIQLPEQTEYDSTTKILTLPPSFTLSGGILIENN